MDDSKAAKLDQAVRPIVTLGMLVIFGWLSITGKISSDAALGLIGMVFGFWFQSRTPTTGAATTTTKTTETDASGVRREVTQTAPPGVVPPPPVAPPPPVTP